MSLGVLSHAKGEFHVRFRCCAFTVIEEAHGSCRDRPESCVDMPSAQYRPYTWLVDVLQRVSTHPARDVTQLTPRL